MIKQEIINIYKKQSIKIFGSSIQERTLSMTKAWTKVIDAWHSYLETDSRHRIESDYRYRSCYAEYHLTLAHEIINLIWGKTDDFAKEALVSYQQTLIEQFNLHRSASPVRGGIIDAYGYAISDIEVVLNGKQ